MSVTVRFHASKISTRAKTASASFRTSPPQASSGAVKASDHCKHASPVAAADPPNATAAAGSFSPNSRTSSRATTVPHTTNSAPNAGADATRSLTTPGHPPATSTACGFGSTTSFTA